MKRLNETKRYGCRQTFTLEPGDIVRGHIIGKELAEVGQEHLWVSQRTRLLTSVPRVGEECRLSHICAGDKRHKEFICIQPCDTGELEFIVIGSVNISNKRPWDYDVRRTR